MIEGGGVVMHGYVMVNKKQMEWAWPKLENKTKKRKKGTQIAST